MTTAPSPVSAALPRAAPDKETRRTARARTEVPARGCDGDLEPADARSPQLSQATKRSRN
jgi:hypothetical protein